MARWHRVFRFCPSNQKGAGPPKRRRSARGHQEAKKAEGSEDKVSGRAYNEDERLAATLSNWQGAEQPGVAR